MLPIKPARTTATSHAWRRCWPVFPSRCPGATVNRLCGSGLEAVNCGYREIRSEEAEIVLAGGSESMTRAPFVMSKAAKSFDRNVEIYDTSIGWRFTNPKLAERYGSHAMGETAEFVGRDYEVTREEQDEFALQSHQRAVAATEAGRFDDELDPGRGSSAEGRPASHHARRAAPPRHDDREAGAAEARVRRRTAPSRPATPPG